VETKDKASNIYKERSVTEVKTPFQGSPAANSNQNIDTMLLGAGARAGTHHSGAFQL